MSLRVHTTGPPDPFSERGFGAIAPWLDLVNSELYDGFGVFTECLEDPRWVDCFLEYWNLRIPANNAVALKSLHELRSILRHLVEKISSLESLNAADLAKLNDFLKVSGFPELVQSQSGFELQFRPAQDDWPAEIAAIAKSFVDSLIHERKGHLKICANEQCRWIFIDRTKGNVRRWCSDATCGNRDRVRRSRAQQKK